MNNFLFIALIVAIIYYFFYYLPSTKKLSPDPIIKPLSSEIGVQTNIPNPEKDEWETKYQGLKDFSTRFLKLTGYSSYQELEKGVKELKEKVKKLEVKKPTASKSTQTDPDPELEITIDNLLQSIQDLNKQIK